MLIPYKIHFQVEEKYQNKTSKNGRKNDVKFC